jgi:hypothetical protein
VSKNGERKMVCRIINARNADIAFKINGKKELRKEITIG